MHSLLLQGKKVSALWDACGLDNRGGEGFDEDSYCIRSNTVPVDRGTRWAMAVNEGAFCTCGGPVACLSRCHAFLSCETERAGSTSFLLNGYPVYPGSTFRRM
jgi:hypothetical protein